MFLAALLLQATAPPVAPSAPAHSAEPMKKLRRYAGVWIDTFEGQTFYEGARRAADIDTRRKTPWLEIDRYKALRPLVEKRDVGGKLPDPYIPHLYRVTFTGVETTDMACKPNVRRLCYGHMGQSPGLIRVDRISSIRDLGPLFSSDNPR